MERKFINVQLTKDEVEIIISNLTYCNELADYPQIAEMNIIKYLKSLIASPGSSIEQEGEIG